MISFHFQFAEPEVVIMDVEPTVSLSVSCRRRRRLCCSKRESESPESYLDGRGDGCFLVSHAGRRDDDRGFQSKRCRRRIRRRRLRLPLKLCCCGFVAIFHHGYSTRVAGVIRLCHRYSFYSFAAEKFNSYYSRINEWPQYGKSCARS